MGLLTNFLSFTPLCYKLGLVKTLIYRTFKINKTWLGFHNGIQSFFTILRKNFFPEHVLDMLLHRYVTRAAVGNNTQPSTGVEQQELTKHYFKIPYIGHFSGVAQKRVHKLINRFCKPIDIKFVYSIFKIKNLFNVKDPLPTGSLRASCTNFLEQAVMLVTLAKQALQLAQENLHKCTSTCHRTDLLTFISICRLQSRAVPLVT